MLSRLRRARTLLSRTVFSVVQGGNRVLCLFCGWRGRKFMAGNSCPQCGSMARHRLIPYASSHFGLDYSQGGLLHVGPNIIEVRFILSRFMAKPYYRLDTKGPAFVNLRGSVCRIPLDDRSVRFALAWHVLEHVADDVSAMHELYRVLAWEGKLLFSVPITPPGREVTLEDPGVTPERFLEVYGHHDHVRACGLDYGTRLEQAGFRVEILRVEDASSGDKAFFGLSGSHVAWCCTKSRPPGHKAAEPPPSPEE